MTLLKHIAGESLPLPGPANGPEQVHVFDDDEIDAVNSALAVRRPLLIRGEPGVGKTQLAKAVAIDLKRAFVQHAVDIRTESRDLLWHFDAVGRLADAQFRGALTGRADASKTAEALSVELKKDLAVEHYLHPRALWWGLNWESAKQRAEQLELPVPQMLTGECSAANGVVVLIDEIDKAESDVPNGLLEALGAGQFTPAGMTEPVNVEGVAPLVIITTNEERTLPDAFLRRCLVLELRLPDDDKALAAHLIGRGQAHFPDADKAVLVEAARQTIEDRNKALDEQWRPLPGQAEYLDLVRGVTHLADSAETQLKLLAKVRPYVLHKHRGAAR